MEGREAEPFPQEKGNSHVYLSGKGNDKNNGYSPADAVRTFRRAKELLEGGEKGRYFTKGADVLICSTVQVEKGDQDWSFGAGGTVTNRKSKETWKPVLKIYEGFDVGADMPVADVPIIQISRNVTFSNITIGHSNLNALPYGHVQLFGINGDEKAEVCFGKGTVIEKLKGGILDREFMLISDYSHCLGKGSKVIFDGILIQECDIISDHDLIKIGRGGSLLIKNGIIQKNQFTLNVGCLICCDGSFSMEGGTVRKNVIQSDSMDSEIGLISLGDGEYEISDGSILDNKIIARGHYSNAFAVLVQNGSVALSEEIIGNNQITANFEQETADSQKKGGL